MHNNGALGDDYSFLFVCLALAGLRTTKLPWLRPRARPLCSRLAIEHSYGSLFREIMSNPSLGSGLHRCVGEHLIRICTARMSRLGRKFRPVTSQRDCAETLL